MRSVASKNDNSVNLCFLIMSSDPYFLFINSFSFLERKSAIIRNILMLLCRIIEQVNVECHMQERTLLIFIF